MNCELHSQDHWLISFRYINFFFVKDDEKNILIWSEHDTDRKYQIVNLQNEKVTLEKHVPGARILCACHVEEYIWLGNEVGN